MAGAIDYLIVADKETGIDVTKIKVNGTKELENLMILLAKVCTLNGNQTICYKQNHKNGAINGFKDILFKGEFGQNENWSELKKHNYRELIKSIDSKR